jgi:hypothetical protein
MSLTGKPWDARQQDDQGKALKHLKMVLAAENSQRPCKSNPVDLRSGILQAMLLFT